nr:hypothetical protein [Mycobacteroides saopaulense]
MRFSETLQGLGVAGRVGEVSLVGPEVLFDLRDRVAASGEVLIVERLEFGDDPFLHRLGELFELLLGGVLTLLRLSCLGIETIDLPEEPLLLALGVDRLLAEGDDRGGAGSV